MDDAQMARLLVSARLAAGAALAVAPTRAVRAWTGEEKTSPSAAMMARALGIRDVALGMGALVALRRGRPVRGWFQAGMLADAGDAVVTLGALRKGVPLARGLLWAGMAAGASALGWRIASSID